MAGGSGGREWREGVAGGSGGREWREGVEGVEGMEGMDDCPHTRGSTCVDELGTYLRPPMAFSSLMIPVIVSPGVTGTSVDSMELDEVTYHDASVQPDAPLLY